MPSSPPDSITATAFFMVHYAKFFINSSTYKNLLLACSLTPTPMTTSFHFFRSSIGSLTPNAFISKFSFLPTKPSITEPPATSPISSTITFLYAASAPLMPTSCLHHSELSTRHRVTAFSIAAPTLWNISP
ncbi:hypothetical protein GOODEAATRI_011737 [Goodea atripinnis]|uniref:Uncharacterized protein n=1 Tax=Goodea atripinnis TaxID=208336 RepID=A0ABV0N9V4_9TELE